MLIYIVLTTLPPSMTTAATNWGAVVIIIMYEVVFAFGWLGTCWVYGPEIAPLKYRHVAGSLGAAGEWFSTFIMVFGGGTGINAVGPKIFIWPLTCCFLAAAYVYWLCPESKSHPLCSYTQRFTHPINELNKCTDSILATGKTLEEIDVLFARSPEVRERLERNIPGRRQSVGHNSMVRRSSAPKGDTSLSELEKV